MTSSEQVEKNELFKSNSNYMTSSTRPNGLFDLNDFPKDGSLNYRSFLMRVYELILKGPNDFCDLQNQSREVFCKKVFLQNSQKSQENTCARDPNSIKLQPLGLQVH